MICNNSIHPSQIRQELIDIIAENFTAFEQRALSFLRSFARYRHRDHIYPSQQRIANGAKVCPRVVRNMLRKAKKLNLLWMDSARDRTSYYYFNDIFYDPEVSKQLDILFLNRIIFSLSLFASKPAQDQACLQVKLKDIYNNSLLTIERSRKMNAKTVIVQSPSPWSEIGHTEPISKKGKVEKSSTPPTSSPVVKDQAYYEKEYLKWEMLRRNEEYRNNLKKLGLNPDDFDNPHAEMAGLPGNPDKWMKENKTI